VPVLEVRVRLRAAGGHVPLRRGRDTVGGGSGGGQHPDCRAAGRRGAVRPRCRAAGDAGSRGAAPVLRFQRRRDRADPTEDRYGGPRARPHSTDPVMETQAAAGGPPGALREALEALPGGRRVLIDAAPPRVLLGCDPPGGQRPVEAAAQALLRREGAPAAPLELQVSYLGAPRTRQRVRFLDLRCTRAASGQLSAVAVL